MKIAVCSPDMRKEDDDRRRIDLADGGSIPARLAGAAPRDRRGLAPEVVLTTKPEPAWLDTMTAAQGHTGERAVTYRAIVGAIALPTAFVALRHDGQLASLAYGAIHDGFLMCEWR